MPMRLIFLPKSQNCEQWCHQCVWNFTSNLIKKKIENKNGNLTVKEVSKLRCIVLKKKILVSYIFSLDKRRMKLYHWTDSYLIMDIIPFPRCYWLGLVTFSRCSCAAASFRVLFCILLPLSFIPAFPDDLLNGKISSLGFSLMSNGHLGLISPNNFICSLLNCLFAYCFPPRHPKQYLHNRIG